MQIQVDIPEELNKQIKIERIQKGYKNLQETIIQILKKYYEEEIGSIIDNKMTKTKRGGDKK